MRGKPCESALKTEISGITPAHAGKTERGALRCTGGGDHPRACGENENPNESETLRKGSPPRMRGKLFALIDGVKAGGITPAHAGKTPSARVRM